MAQELHIGIFGKRNQGKSSLINLLTGQQTAIVSEKPGTTTDPVKKSCEILGIGKCVLVDTAGFDDEGEVGRLRVEKTKETIARMDTAVLLISNNTFAEDEKNFADLLQKDSVPFLILHNKADKIPLSDGLKTLLAKRYPSSRILDFSIRQALAEKSVSGNPAEDPGRAVTEQLRAMLPQGEREYDKEKILEGIVEAGDTVVLVCPIDKQATRDRLILPQVLMARQCLDMHALPLLCQTEELPMLLASLHHRPSLVITDSQAFKEVAALVPADMPLTGFSLCMARGKGHFNTYVAGTRHLTQLRENDEVLILESCTHQVNCQDIGRVKLPAALRKVSGKNLRFRFVAGLDPLPDNLQDFALAVQCGGCMVSDRQLSVRIDALCAAGIPVSNYGMALAWANGIFERAVGVFERK